jgi:PAS domain S-box-containing protein
MTPQPELPPIDGTVRFANRNRLAMAVVAPALALLAFSVWMVADKLESYRRSADLLASAQIVRAGQATVRELQKERGVSALMLGSNRSSWQPELADQRAITDEHTRELREVLARPQNLSLFGPQRPDLGLGAIDGIRAAADGDAAASTVIEGYNAVVSRVMAATSRLPGDELGNIIAGYMDLGHLRDRVSRQRTIGNTLLATGRRDGALQIQFIEAHAEQHAFLVSMRSHLPATYLRPIDEIMASPAMIEIDRLYGLLGSGPLSPADIGSWLRGHAEVLDKMSAAEEHMAIEMERSIKAELDTTKFTFWLVVLAVLALMAFALETLRRSERRAWVAQEEARKLLRAVEQSPVSVMITDPKGMIEWVNPNFTRTTGYGRDEVIGQNPRLLRSHATPQETYRDLWVTIGSGQEWRGEMCNRRKDGSLYWESMTVAPVKGSDGKVINFIALKEDITEVKSLRRTVQHEHDNFQRVLESIHDGIALIDAQGGFEYVNRALEDEFGPVAGCKCSEYFADDIPTGGAPGTARRPWRREWRSAINGKIYELTNTEVQKPDGSVSVLQVFHDITARKQAEDAVNDAREAAELANRAKSEFLSTMSHELRTPLNAIIGFSEIIESELLGPLGQRRYVEYAHDINESGRHLLQLITDILDVAHLDVGRVMLRETEVDIAAVLRSSMLMVRERAEAGAVTIVADPSPNLPLLWADERRIKQMLVNVLGNAVKFTPAGGHVTISASQSTDGSLEVVISDTGIGIAPEDIAKVMATFSQVDSGMNRRYEGSGLGLPLTHRLMVLHGGSIGLESRLGSGTDVTLRFPKERVVAPQLASNTGKV